MHAFEHQDVVNCVAFSPDGLLVASASRDGVARIWRHDPAVMVRALTHPASVESVAFAPDGATLATGTTDGRIFLWRVADGRLVVTRHQGVSVKAIAFSAQGTILAVAGETPAICLWRLSDMTVVQPVTQRVQQAYYVTEFSPAMATDVAFFADDRSGASPDGTSVYLWDVHDGAIRAKVQSGLYAIYDIDVSPDGTLLVTAQDEMYPRLWRVSDGADLGLFRYVIDADVTTDVDAEISSVSVRFSPDGALLASGGTGGVLQLWRVADRSPVQSFLGHSDSIGSIAFSPDGTVLASGSYDKTMRLWSVTA